MSKHTLRVLHRFMVFGFQGEIIISNDTTSIVLSDTSSDDHDKLARPIAEWINQVMSIARLHNLVNRYSHIVRIEVKIILEED